MTIKWQLPALGILCLIPLTSTAQEVVPYAKSEVKVDWVRGTDFSKYKTYACETTHATTATMKHAREDIGTALQAKGLQKVEMDANPSLIVAVSGSGKLAYAIEGFWSLREIKQGTLVVELADAQSKKAVWWGIADEALTDNPDKDVPMVQKKISKMFEKYPPPTKK